MPFPRLSEGRFSSCTVLTDEALFAATGVRIAFTQRTGGVSIAPFDSLNLGGHVDDAPEHVAENRRRLLEAFGAQDAALIQPNQVHGSTVAVCPKPGDAASCHDAARLGADAVVVGCADVSALLCFADCVPVIIAAPTGAFAVVHAGWRGVVARIVESAIAWLTDLSGAAADTLNVYIGPHIRQCHFQVGPDVAQRFADEFGADVVDADRHVDMSASLRCSLESCGIAPERIVDARVCTVCDAGEHYYSYRASEGRCGRHAAFAVRMSNNRKEGVLCR